MSCSKIFSGDLPELASEIIKYFQNDFSTLYSCILVNRFWCRLAIQLLWENPFSTKFPKNHHFIEIYLQKLNDNDKVKLNEYGFNNDEFPSNTLFNYSRFIKCLNTEKISSSIETLVKNKMLFTNLSRLTSFIFLSLIKIFIENEASLHTFEVSYILNSDCFNSAFQLILQNPNFVRNVKNLNIYLLGLNSNLLSFPKCFSNCDSISSLYIHFSDYYYTENDLSKVIKVISSQQNLKKIYFKYALCPLESIKNSNCSNTLKTFIIRKINLEKLAVNFSEVFEQLNVLESIHILYCYPLNSVIIQQIINSTKPFKLKSLFMNERSISQIEPLKLLLQKSGNYLENIGLKSIDHELKLQLFKLIQIYCINIKFINLLGFDDQNIFPALDLIENIKQNLNYLIINFCQFDIYHSSLNSDNTLSSIVLQNLGQILPNRLEYLSLALKININDLEVFFKNSQNIFIRKLLIRNKLYQKGDDILPCIKKYVMKEKRVTYLAIENLLLSKRDDLSDLKDEVKEFKFYGIQITHYNDLDIKVCDHVSEMY
jgi:hypothetical protein